MNERSWNEAALLDTGAQVATTRFLDLPFSCVNLQQAAVHVRQAAEEARWKYIVTPNAAHLARLGGGDPELSRIYEHAHMCLLDSRVVARVAHLAGLKAPPVVTGADLVAELFTRVIEPSLSICIIGGTPILVQRLRERYRLGEIAHLNPSIGFWRDRAEMAHVVDFIVSAQANLTFLVVGSPQQEILADLVASRGGARGVGICAGASLEFLTDMRRRAPRMLQRLSLEWAYRLCTEPRRMARRYLVESPDGIRLVLREALRQ